MVEISPTGCIRKHLPRRKALTGDMMPNLTPVKVRLGLGKSPGAALDITGLGDSSVSAHKYSGSEFTEALSRLV
jgi:hypothetical protein